MLWRLHVPAWTTSSTTTTPLFDMLQRLHVSAYVSRIYLNNGAFTVYPFFAVWVCQPIFSGYDCSPQSAIHATVPCAYSRKVSYSYNTTRRCPVLLRVLHVLAYKVLIYHTNATAVTHACLRKLDLPSKRRPFAMLRRVNVAPYYIRLTYLSDAAVSQCYSVYTCLPM